MNPGLTSFRFFAFFAVFLYHERLGDFGYLGVHAFFVLSGFLLCPILLDMKQNLVGKSFFTHFYGRRALRIFPLYYFYLLIFSIPIIITLQFQENFGRLEYLPSQLPWLLTYTYNFYHMTDDFKHLYLVSHLWSLSIEEQFYLLWPLIIFFTPRQHIKSLLLGIMLCGPLRRWGLSYLISHDIMPVYRGNMTLAIYLFPLSYLDAFATGGFFALYGKSHGAQHVIIAIVSVIVIGLGVDWLFLKEFTWQHLGYAAHMKDTYKYIWGYSLISLLVGYMLINIQQRQLFPSLMENRTLVYLGTISYGLYVYHYIVVWLVNMLTDLPRIGQAPIALVISIVIAVLSYELLEKRFIGMKDRYFSR